VRFVGGLARVEFYGPLRRPVLVSAETPTQRSTRRERGREEDTSLRTVATTLSGEFLPGDVTVGLAIHVSQLS